MAKESKNRQPKPSFSLGKIFQAASQEATGSKTSSYLITTAAVGLFYIAIGVLVAILVPDEVESVAWIVLSFLFAVFFSPIRYAMEEMLRQLFPGMDYSSHETIKRLNTISYSSLTLERLSQLFFKELEAGLEIIQAAFVFADNKGNLVLDANDKFQNLTKLSKEEVEHLLARLERRAEPVEHFRDEAAEKVRREQGILLSLPLTNNDQLVGAMLLGKKYREKAYTTKDKKVLEAIAPKIGFAVVNAFSHQEVQHKNEDLIGDLKEANEQLRKANRQLKHDDKLKDEFVYVATHELKNPVTAIRGYLSLILEGRYGKIPEKLTAPLKQLNTSNQQLITLLNNLLQIARAEAQTLKIETAPVQICPVIDKVIKDMQPLVTQKKLSVVHSCPNPAVTVMADRERLLEIINNLVSNAIKYSTTGEIEISHEIVHDQLVTHVKDQGVGISKDDQKRLFTRFFRVEEEAAKGIPGTGLGLFIVKQLLEKMEGRIWYKSQVDKGSTFSFSLPLARTYALHHQTAA